MIARPMCVVLVLSLCLLSLIVPALARAEATGSLVIAGNGPELPTMEALARAFEKANPRAYVDLLWDDNSKPLDLVKKGEAHIAVTGAEDPALAATRVVGLSASAMPEDRDRCRSAGMDDFVAKPVRLSEIEAAIRRNRPA
mgnify:CR=1 FL=1